jgi:cytochrome c oxidase assembly protein subunit 15
VSATYDPDVTPTRSEPRAEPASPPRAGRVGRVTSAIFWAGLVAQVGIVLTGGLVRLTGSGLGCPTWPTCSDDSYVPVRTQPQGFHRYIEFGNRMLTFVLAVVLVACVVAAWRHRPRRRPLVVLALLGIAGIFGQAVLGGITVLTDLNPWLVGSHFLLSMALIAVSVLLVTRGTDEGDAPPVPRVRPEVRVLGRVIIGLTLLVLVLGTVVTGSGPHSGDANTPRNGLDPRSLSWLHADAVLLLVGLIVALLIALRLTDAPADLRLRAWFLAAVVLAQGAIGYTQYFTGLPEGVVAAHVLGACLVWVGALRVYLGMRTRGPADHDGVPVLTTE